MLTDGLQLLGSSTASNFTIASGATLPSAGLTAGELFYQTGVGLNVYTGSSWVAVGSSATAASIATALGYTPAALDGTGVLTSSQVPAIAITDTFVVATQAAMLALTAQVGDVAVRTDTSTSYILKAAPATTLANWQQLLVPNSAVISVNGNTGTVVLSTTDITEGTRLYYTDARARAAISVSGTGATYNSTTGVLTFTAGSGSSGTATVLSGTGTYPSNATVISTSGVYAGAYSGLAVFGMVATGAPTDQKYSAIETLSTGALQFQLVNDAVNSLNAWMTVTRSGTTASNITIATTQLNHTGLTGGFMLNGNAGTAGQVLTSQGASAAPTWTTVSGGSSTVLTATGTFSGSSSAATGVYGGVQSNVAYLGFQNLAAAADTKFSLINIGTSGISWTFNSDNGSSYPAWLTVGRSGTTATAITLVGTAINLTGAVTGTSFTGVGTGLTALNATNLASGTVGTARLGTGTASATTYLRGDGTWTAPSTVLTTGYVGFGVGGVLGGVAGFTFSNATAVGNTHNVLTFGDAAGAVTRGLTIQTPTVTGGSTSQGQPDINIIAGNGLSSSANSGFVNITSGSAASTTDGAITFNTSTVGGAATERLRILGTGGIAFGGAANYGVVGAVLQSNGASAVPTWSSVPTLGTLTTNSTFSGSQTVTGVRIGSDSSASALVNMYNSAAGTDMKTARMTQTSAGLLVFDFVNDAYSSSSAWLTVGRSAATPSYVQFSALVRPSTDNTLSLGAASNRWSTVYAGTSAISTSDENLKTEITDLTSQERAVAVAAKALLKKFKFKDAVAAKGDKARWHVGIIAQELQGAFTSNGLDAYDYAMFCSDTWTDEDGTEQTRLGVRYEELLAFIIAAM